MFLIRFGGTRGQQIVTTYTIFCDHTFFQILGGGSVRGLHQNALLERAGLIQNSIFEKMHFLDGFGHEDQKFHFRADWTYWGQANLEMPTFPDHWEVRDRLSNEKPYRLITPPARWFLNSTFNEMSLSQDRLLSPKAWMIGFNLDTFRAVRKQIVKEQPAIAHNLTVVRRETLIRWFENQGATKSIAE